MANANPIEVQKYLAGVDYPARRDELVTAAKDNGADERTLELLKWTFDRDYEGPSRVGKEIGGSRRQGAG
ncbi:DUF2795 domain-containing protein [Amycolatopsis sp. FDAARGOS 1241]|uniref:DUF2795 domain-containing protein n=1 Tax=Amycolatopsis sp. FDAARGOS 1241 TaxID=2778070 RepID=UPI001952968A|nr:DUF2795 domain-containing protein [Amycolatopsis sp. FDAARGOS 1241]QRP49702.1 DUF2795 domain-containing protein [Amycolatopsis sp. FDAARGOS 1241]